MCKFALLYALLGAVFGQELSVPYAPGSDGPGPTFSSSDIDLSYPGDYSSITKVDFVTLVEEHQKRDPGDNYAARFGSVFYLGSSLRRTAQYGVVLYTWSDGGGSSSQGEAAQIFRLSEGRLRCLQKIEWDTHVQTNQPWHSFDPRTNRLVVRSSHYISGDAHCCVSAVDVVTFRWDGTRFVQSGLRTELSTYGKNEGKTLPKPGRP